MTDSHTSSELPQQVIAELQEMGGLQAPPELWEGVSSQLIADKLAPKQAPDKLWDGVHARLIEEGVASKPTRIFGLQPIYAAAAALLIVLGVAFQLDWSGSSSIYSPQLAPVMSDSAKAEIRSHVVFVEVQAHEMSGASQSLAAALGGVSSEVVR